MRLVARHGERFVFQLGSEQARRLRDTLALYPLLPDHYQQISRQSDAATPTSQALLDQFIAEHRGESGRAINALLADPTRFRNVLSNWELWLTPGEADHLLQVLNDIRVGSWVKLGSPPQGRFRNMALNPGTAPHFLNILICDEFMGPLLEALAS